MIVLIIIVPMCRLAKCLCRVQISLSVLTTWEDEWPLPLNDPRVLLGPLPEKFWWPFSRLSFKWPPNRLSFWKRLSEWLDWWFEGPWPRPLLFFHIVQSLLNVTRVYNHPTINRKYNWKKKKNEHMYRNDFVYILHSIGIKEWCFRNTLWCATYLYGSQRYLVL